MHRAATSDSVNAMEWLKAQGVDINAQTDKNKTPLRLAIKNSNDKSTGLSERGERTF